MDGSSNHRYPSKNLFISTDSESDHEQQQNANYPPSGNYVDQKSDEESDATLHDLVQDSYSAPNSEDDVDNFRPEFRSEFNSSPKKASRKRKAEYEPEPVAFQMNPKVQRMMQNMDYKGKGLGKHEQGIAEPIEASKQKGRRGLGFQFVGLEQAVKQFNPDDEVIELEENVRWLHCGDHYTLEYSEISNWMTLGKQKLTLDDEANFCNPEILKGILKSKSVFDCLDKYEMRNARTRSNPFETLRNAFFQNRAALKMANLDKMCDFMFTDPPKVHSTELLYFADVCAGPGGFSEYVLWRKQLKCKGFGFTLKRSNDFKLEDFLAGPTENFHPYYGPSDDLAKQGDVFLPENQEALKDVIMEHTNGLGVHFMMADGGFSVEGQENIQEILSKQLYLCQCLVALMIVREGGHFVTKLFDVFTPFSAGLVYLMYRAFETVSIVKPNTSRPANSERYLVCKSKRPDTAGIEEYLFNVNRFLQKNGRDPQMDVTELVPLSYLKDDRNFYDYLKESNDEIGRRQITGLVKIAYYCEKKNLIERRQGDIRLQCLQLWGVPSNVKRMDFKSLTLEEFLKKELPQDAVAKLSVNPHQILDAESLHSRLPLLNFPYSYCYAVLQYDPQNSPPECVPSIYVGLGGNKVYRCDPSGWTKIEEIALPPSTVVYAEVVTEYNREGAGQMKRRTLHIIDAYIINGKSLNDLSIQERSLRVKLMCVAMWGVKDNNSGIPVRAKSVVSLKRNVVKQFELRPVQMKGKNQQKLAYVIAKDELTHKPDHESPHFFVPGSMMFFKFTSNSYTRNWSYSKEKMYYYNGNVENTVFQEDLGDRREMFADFFECHTQTRFLWSWLQRDSLTFEQFSHAIVKNMPI